MKSKDRSVIERFGSKAEPYRRVATGYEKMARNVLAFGVRRPDGQAARRPTTVSGRLTIRLDFRQTDS